MQHFSQIAPRVCTSVLFLVIATIIFKHNKSTSIIKLKVLIIHDQWYFQHWKLEILLQIPYTEFPSVESFMKCT